MSSTPKTDALWQAQNRQGFHDIDEVWEHARQLERELTYARAAVYLQRKRIDLLEGRIVIEGATMEIK